MAASTRNNTRHLLSDLSPDESKYLLDNILCKICEHLDEQELTDVTFKVLNPDAMIKAHRLVLSSASPLFKEMFRSVERKDPIIDIYNVDSTTFERMITFCYTGKMLITIDNVDLTLRAAKILQLDRALSNCIEFIMENIAEYTLPKAYALASETKCDALEETLMKYQLTTYTTMVMNSPEYEKYTIETMRQVIYSNEPNKLRNKNFSIAMKLFPSLKESVRITQFDSNFFFANTRALRFCDLEDKMCWVNHPSNRASMTLKFAKPLQEQNNKIPLKEATVLALNLSGVATGVMLQYNKTDDSWEEWTKINIDLNCFQVILKDTELIFIGGSRNDKPVGEVMSWNFKNKRLKKLSSLIEPRHSHSVVLLNNNIYAIGGMMGSDSFSNLVEMYCTNDKKWKPIKGMILPRYDAKAVALHGKIYVLGGKSAESENRSVECYNPATNKWNMCAPMNRAHGCPGAIVQYGHIIVVGGFECRPMPTVERYNPELNRWTVIHSLNTGRAGPACFSLDNKLWAVGGFLQHCGCEAVGCVEVYDEQIDQWIDKKPMPEGRYCCFTVPKTLLE